MLFSSISFLYYFIPAVVVFYFISPKGLKNTVLLVSSLFFYGWGEPKYLIFMLTAIIQGYFFGILIEKYHDGSWSKFFLTVSILISLGLLGYCKYADFFLTNFNAITGSSIPLLHIALPIGISFYTFQILSYTIDVYRREVTAQKNLINLAAYITMFPQLIAGPIVRYSDIAIQLEHRTHSLSNAAMGIRRFLIGLSKKVLIANVIGELAAISKSPNESSVLFVWMYAIANVLQIYFDFSGYSDMAIGLGKLFGFQFLENFNYPYISNSITEFWRRWHISLGSWFRDYLYIPLGGSRVSKWKWIRNLFLVWMVTGLWHGAAWNFVLWGLLFAILLIIEKLWLLKHLEKLKLLRHFYVLLFIIVSFILFEASSIEDAFSVIRAMFGASNLPLITVESIYYLKSYALLLIISIIGATPLPSKLFHLAETYPTSEHIVNTLEPICLVLLLAVNTAFLIDGSFNPFLYFRF
ncbi:Peptidoglycan O-acetyltransferase [Clostridiales bacterium CHKCI001]|nr:Peptidoglycan O-acetyltransferase [Clostridiales bacterium CHKCI001]